MMGERLNGRALVPHENVLRDRRLRNRIVIGNAIATMVIALLIGLILL